MNVGRSSSFELIVNGQLIHSKLNGEGFINDYETLS